MSHTGSKPCSSVSNTVGVILCSTFLQNCCLSPAPFLFPLLPQSHSCGCLCWRAWRDWHTTLTGTWDIYPFLHTCHRSLQAPSVCLAHAKFTDNPSQRKLGLPVNCISKNKIKLTKLHFLQKHHNHFLVIPYWLLIAVAAVLQKPSKLLPLSHQQCWGATWHQWDFCGGEYAFSSLFIFLSLSACSIRSFSSYGISVQQTAHHPSPSTALLKQGLETHSETPTEGWQDFDDVGTILSLLFCKPCSFADD